MENITNSVKTKLKAKKDGSWTNKRGNRGSQSQRYRDRYKHRNRANQAVYRAVKSGRLKRPENCEKCGNGGRILAHHKDYNKQLAVEWLCSDCHNKRHGRQTKWINT